MAKKKPLAGGPRKGKARGNKAVKFSAVLKQLEIKPTGTKVVLFVPSHLDQMAKLIEAQSSDSVLDISARIKAAPKKMEKKKAVKTPTRRVRRARFGEYRND